MKAVAVLAAVALATLAYLPLTTAQDPASSWLVYAKAPGHGKRVTFVNATWTVPSYPANRNGFSAPGWWFGIEPEPALDLIQPILAWGDGAPQFTIFNGRFNWNNGGWWQSQDGVVTPGNTVTAYVEYVKSDSSYNMYIACEETGFSVSNNVKTSGASEVFTDTYFVVEHQPQNCDAYPANGDVIFRDIHIEIEGKPVKPQWEIKQFRPACNSQGQVVNDETLKFTWDTSSDTGVDSAATTSPAAGSGTAHKWW